MRLGDLDRIAQDVRDNNIENYYKQDWTSSQIVTLLENAPTINAVPVVRCRDCKHYQHYGKTSLLENGKNVKAGWCYRRIRFDEECRMPADGFCSYGQRKEDDHD